MTAGTTKPPKAAIAGSVAPLRLASGPSMTSRLISRAIRRKKTAIRPSLIQCSRVLDRASEPILISPVACSSASYCEASGELARISAARVATPSTTPPYRSVLLSWLAMVRLAACDAVGRFITREDCMHEIGGPWQEGGVGQE